MSNVDPVRMAIQAMTPSVYQRVSFIAVDPPGPRVDAWLDDQVPKFTSQGGWQFVDRSRLPSITEFQGVKPYTLEVYVLFEGMFNESSVEPQIEMLRRLMRDRVGPRQEPAVIRVSGAAIPLSNLQWVIQDMIFTDEIKRADGARIRAAVTVQLFQYIAPTIMLSTQQSPAEAAQARSPTVTTPTGSKTTTTANTTTPKTYTVKAGDTLYAIAARQLGTGNRWPEIADLNGIRDPTKLQIGTVLKLP